jgi:hypothetical protein
MIGWGRHKRAAVPGPSDGPTHNPKMYPFVFPQSGHMRTHPMKGGSCMRDRGDRDRHHVHPLARKSMGARFALAHQGGSPSDRWSVCVEMMRALARAPLQGSSETGRSLGLLEREGEGGWRRRQKRVHWSQAGSVHPSLGLSRWYSSLGELGRANRGAKARIADDPRSPLGACGPLDVWTMPLNRASKFKSSRALLSTCVRLRLAELLSWALRKR